MTKLIKAYDHLISVKYCHYGKSPLQREKLGYYNMTWPSFYTPVPCLTSSWPLALTNNTYRNGEDDASLTQSILFTHTEALVSWKKLWEKGPWTAVQEFKPAPQQELWPKVLLSHDFLPGPLASATSHYTPSHHLLNTQALTHAIIELFVLPGLKLTGFPWSLVP